MNIYDLNVCNLHLIWKPFRKEESLKIKNKRSRRWWSVRKVRESEWGVESRVLITIFRLDCPNISCPPFFALSRRISIIPVDFCLYKLADIFMEIWKYPPVHIKIGFTSRGRGRANVRYLLASCMHAIIYHFLHSLNPEKYILHIWLQNISIHLSPFLARTDPTSSHSLRR